MADNNNVRFGLSNVHYAAVNRAADGTITFGSVKRAPNAVSLTMTREGGDSSDFYADNGVVYSSGGTNDGYSADWEFAKVTDTMRADFLGEVVDDNSVQYEYGDTQPNEMVVIAQVEGDVNPKGFQFFGVKASRVELTANTKGESTEIDTETLHTRITGLPLPVWDATANAAVTRNVVQGHLTKDASNAATFATFMTTVMPPTATRG